MERNSASPVRDSILHEAARLAKRHGNFVKQGQLLEQAWAIAKTRDRAIPDERRLADGILADYLQYLTNLGQKDALRSLLDAVASLELSGSGEEARLRAREKLWFFENRAESNVFCGFTAANDICVPLGKPPIFPEVHDDEEKKTFIRDGLSLYELRAHSHEGGGDLQIIKRVSGSAIPVPSVVHFSFDHYSALTEREGEFVRLKDDNLAFNSWIENSVLNAQVSGYFLVPGDSEIPPGFVGISDEEAKSVFGRHCVHARDAEGCKVTGGGNGRTCPMATYQFSMLNPGIVISDTPVQYVPPYGPSVDFSITYDQRSTVIEDLAQHGNFGPRWTYGYLAFITLNGIGLGGPDSPNADVSYVDNRGQFFTYDQVGTSSLYSSRFQNMPRLEWRSSTEGGPGYILFWADGSEQHFLEPNSATAPTRYYLKKIVNPQGNATLSYDSEMRLVTVTDALNHPTILTYGNSTFPTRITGISDGRGRAAQIAYDGQGRLSKITDPVGITSEFEYTGDLISALVTPYGRTQFRWGDLPGINSEPGRFAEAIDPYGDRERVEGNDFANYPAGGVDSHPAPTSVMVNGTSVNFLPKNYELFYRNTFYWDKNMWRKAPGDYSNAVVYNWLALSGDKITGVLGSLKRPMESRIWFNYPWQESNSGTGLGSTPSKTVRAVEGPTGDIAWTMRLADYGDRRSQQPVVNPNYPKVGTTNYAANPFGKLLGTVDAEGRTIIYNYAPNGMDLLSVQVKDGTGWKTLVSYSGYVNHQPTYITDASGLLTTINRTSNGQPEYVIRSKGGQSETTKFTYTAGYLTKIEQTDPANASGLVMVAEFTYDGAKRVLTHTSADGYTLTYSYDAIDRVTLISHPDQTTEQFVYDKLDLFASKDRGGLWTRTLHNANRQPVLVQDPAGQLTQIEWCRCGDIRKIIDPLGRVTHWKHDSAGRLTEKVYPDGSKETYSHQPLSGRLASVTPPSGSGQMVTYNYHLDGQLASEDYAAADTPDVAYKFNDPLGRMKERIDGVGTTSYGYKPLDGATAGAGQLAAADGPWDDDILDYTYDWRGGLLTRRILSDSAAVLRTETVQVDSLGRVASVTNGLGTFAHTFDSGNSGPRVNSISGPGGLDAEYGYFPLNTGGGKAMRLENITNRIGANTISSFTYDYDASGRATMWDQQQNSVLHKWDMEYSRSSELVEGKKRDNVGNVVEARSWTYDGAGNRVVDNDGSVAMTAFFNSLNELKRQGGAGETLIEGTVDKPALVTVDGEDAKMINLPGTQAVRFSRLIAVNEGVNTVEINATDADDNVQTDVWQFTVPPTQRSFVYDSNGNLLDDGNRTYTWDSKNRLKSATVNGTVYAWEYDGVDRRVEERVDGILAKRWIWDGTQMVQERSASNGVVRNYFASGYTAGSNVYLYNFDHLGSIREVSDVNGNVLARYDYDLWGQRTTITGTLEAVAGYTGHYTHRETGLILTLYRAYDAQTGRWLSRDPIGEAGGINLYGYVSSNPINLWDPLGLWQVTMGGGFGGFGYITFGSNGGKKNFGFGFGAGAGGILQYSADNSPINSNCSEDGTTQVGLAAFAEGNLGGIVNSGIRGDLLVQHWSERQPGVGLHGNVRGVGRIVGSSGINLPGSRNLPSGGIDFVGGGFEGYVQASSSSVGCFESGGGSISSGASFGFSSSGFVGLQMIREW